MKAFNNLEEGHNASEWGDIGLRRRSRRREPTAHWLLILAMNENRQCNRKDNGQEESCRDAAAGPERRGGRAGQVRDRTTASRSA